MKRFWKGALAVAGLGLVGGIFIWSRNRAAPRDLELAEQAAKAGLKGRLVEARQAFVKATKRTANFRVMSLAFEFYFRTGDLTTAEQMMERWLAISSRDAESADTAAAYGNLALIYQTQGELDRAEEMHKKSLAIAEKLGSQEGMATQYANLGLVAKQRGNLAGARELWTKARDLYAKIGMPHMIKQVQGWLDALPKE